MHFCFTWHTFIKQFQNQSYFNRTQVMEVKKTEFKDVAILKETAPVLFGSK